MKNNKEFSLLITLFFMFFNFSLNAKNLDKKNSSNTRITFNLKAGSQLFISFPISIISTKEIVLYDIKKDSVFTLDISSDTPFTLLNLNKQNTQFVFFPSFEYFVEIKKNQVDLDFVCTDQYKQYECNVLSKMEKSVGKLNVSEEDGDNVFNDLIKGNKYTHELDSFYTDRKNSRLSELKKFRSENKISQDGFEVLKKYVECSFIRNRFMPLYYGVFERNNFSDWYKDTMKQYTNYFDDTTLINTRPFKGALRCMNIFLATAKEGSNTIDAQFKIAEKFSKLDVINELMMFYILNDPTNKKDKNYTK